MVAVFHGVHSCLGHSSLELFQAAGWQVKVSHGQGNLVHGLPLVSWDTGYTKFGECVPVMVVFYVLGNFCCTRLALLRNLAVSALQCYERDIVLLFPIVACEGSKLGQQEINDGRPIEILLEQLHQMREAKHLASCIVRL